MANANVYQQPALNRPTGLLDSGNYWMQQAPAGPFPGSAIAGFTPSQQRAWSSGQGAAANIAHQGNVVGKQFMDNMQMGQQGNPWLDDYVSRMQDSMQRNYNRNTAPSIGDAATGAGQFGGSRHGVAQANSLDNLNQNIGDMTAKMYSQGYGQGLDYTRGMSSQAPGMFSSWSNSQLAPSNTLSKIGAQQQGMNQQRLSEASNLWNQMAGLPNSRLSQYGAIIAPENYARYGTTEQNVPYNPWASAIGGAMSGAGVGQWLSNQFPQQASTHVGSGTPYTGGTMASSGASGWDTWPGAVWGQNY